MSKNLPPAHLDRSRELPFDRDAIVRSPDLDLNWTSPRPKQDVGRCSWHDRWFSPATPILVIVEHCHRVCTTEGGVLAIFSTIAGEFLAVRRVFDFELLAIDVREKGRIVHRLLEGAPQNGNPVRRNAGRRHIGPRISSRTFRRSAIWRSVSSRAKSRDKGTSGSARCFRKPVLNDNSHELLRHPVRLTRNSNTHWQVLLQSLLVRARSWFRWRSCTRIRS